MARPNDDQVRALAEFAVRALRYAAREDTTLGVALDGLAVRCGLQSVEGLPGWLLEAAGQHTLTNEDGNGE